MTDKPSVSVVVLNYNGLHHLEECFGSLLNLGYPQDKVELILVDNASKKNPAALMAEKYPSVKVILNDVNYGFARGSDIGAEAATGEYVAFLNNDTRVHPDWLTRLVEAINEDEGLVCIGSRILNWEGDAIDFIGAQLNFYGHGFQESFRSRDTDKYKEPREVLFACGGAMLIDRAVFLDVGGFDADYFAFFEDVDLGWRLWLFGYRVVLEPKAIVYHKHHGTASNLQSERKYVMYERNALYTIIKNYDEKNLNKILPVALLLAVKRGLVNAGTRKETYYLPDGAVVSGKKATKPVIVREGVNAPEPELSAMEKISSSLKEEGFFATVGNVIRKVVATVTLGLISRGRRVPKGMDLVPRLGMAHFIGLDDVIENLTGVLEKRDLVQARRKRPDTEILRLFGAPWKSNCLDPSYIAAQEDAVASLGLDKLFRESER